jgi:hypothetical protein
VPDKDEIVDAFVARYGDVVYFGADRFANNGDAQMGFWFFRQAIGTNPDGTFSGVHEDGDILVLSNFTNGGGTVAVRVYQWNPPGGPQDEFPDVDPEDLINGTLVLLGGNAAARDCVVSPLGTNDEFCGTVNAVDIPSANVPWEFTPKSGSGIRAGELYEGGIDLAQLGLENECFASFLAETRASTSVDATLKDFVGGSFEACGSTVVTTPKPDTSIQISDGSVEVWDSAELNVTGVDSFQGTLKFWLCGPDDLASESATCETGGTAITPDIDADTNGTYTSTHAFVTKAGRYCWRAEFSSTTSGVPTSSDSTSTECFTVTPVPTQTSTAANPPGPVGIGTFLNDMATITGAANRPTDPVINLTDTLGDPASGKVTFKLYGPDDTNCSQAPVYTQEVDLVSGQAATTPGYQANVAGTYRWVATYAGDSPNTLGSTGACNDENENVVVNPNQPTIVTNAIGLAALNTAISDSATVSGLTSDATGTVTFHLFGPDDAMCTGTDLLNRQVALGTVTSGSATVSSGDFTPTAPGEYRWIAEYSGDANNLAASGSCNDADELTLVVSTSITTGQFLYPNDAATITASGGGDLEGSVVFTAYTDSNCALAALYTSPAIDIETGTGAGLNRTVETQNITNRVSASTTVYWKVVYTSANPNHPHQESACGDEQTVLTINNNALP